MKKMYKYILIITLMMFSFIGEVRAGKNNFRTLCTYEPTDKGETIKVGYMLDEIVDCYAIYKNDKFEQYINGSVTSDISKKNVEQFNSNICPKYVNYFNAKLTDGIPNYCLDDGDNTCATTYPDNTIEWTKELVTNNMEETKGVAPNVSLNDCVDKKECHILCYYADDNANDYSLIYYFPNENKFKTSFSWKGNNKVYDLNTESGTAFIGIDEKKDLKNAICPNYIYKDENWNDEDEVCFDSDGEYCVGRLSGHFDISEKLTNITPKTLLSYDDLQKLLMDNLECDEALEEILKISNNDKIYDICSYKKNLDGGGEVDQIFIVNYNNKYDIFRYSKNSSGVFEFKKTDIRSELTYEISCTEYGEIYLNDVVTKNYQTDSNGQCIEINSNSYKYFSEKKLKNTTGFGCSPSTINNSIHYQYPDLCKVEKNEEGELVIIDNCNDLLGDSLISEINSYLLYIKIAVPIIIIVMGSIDFGTAFIASDEDKMKNAQKKFIMRLIIGMVIFFIPSIINALLKIANDVWGIFGGSCDVGF